MAHDGELVRAAQRLRHRVFAEEFGARVLIRATVAVSRPEEVDTADVASVFPVGAAQVTAVRGGLTVDGLCIPRFGDTDRSIEAALAAVEVFVRD